VLPRAQRRHNVARPGKRAHAELEMAAGRLPRAREFRHCQRNRRASTERSNQTARRSNARLRTDQEFGLRIGNGVPDRSCQLVSATDSERPRFGPHLWFFFDECVERARCSGLGIPAAGSVSLEKLCDEYFAVGRNLGSARAVSKPIAETGSGAAALS